MKIVFCYSKLKTSSIYDVQSKRLNENPNRNIRCYKNVKCQHIIITFKIGFNTYILKFTMRGK